VITRRGWEAVLVALAALLIAYYTLSYLLILLAVVAFAFLAAEISTFHLETRSVRPEAFRIDRSAESGRLALGARGRTTVRVQYEGDRGIVAESFDTLPDALHLLGPEPRSLGWWEPGSSRSLTTQFTAGLRGSFVLGPTVVLVQSRLGLAERRIELPSELPVQIVPENPTHKPGTLRRKIFTRVQGRVQLRHRGYGTEFRSLRPYQYSDDIRHVAWRRSTPTDLVVREFEQESRQDIVLLIDVSPAMLAGRPGENVLDRTSEAATLVASYAMRSGEDRMGLLTYSEKVRQYLRPARGSPHFRRVFQNVALLKGMPGSFSLSQSLDAVCDRVRAGAHVLAFTALEEPLHGLHQSLLRFTGRGHHLYLFVPDLTSFYPIPEDPALGHAMRWASEEDRLRLHRAFAELHAESIPSVTFDRRGAGTKVISAYGQLRGWGTAS
jgi:uncharacterized protein (DUF58 family)